MAHLAKDSRSWSTFVTLPRSSELEWQRVDTAPFDRDLEVAVVDCEGIHALVYPSRRILRGWMNPQTKMPVTIYPTHWREWQ
jgi:hypothetical protein